MDVVTARGLTTYYASSHEPAVAGIDFEVRRSVTASFIKPQKEKAPNIRGLP